MATLPSRAAVSAFSGTAPALLLLKIHLRKLFHDSVEFLLLLLVLDTVGFLREFHLIGFAELDLGFS